MATNTNYTTKTAALKATKADMRQVAVSKKLTSKEVWIDDAEGKSTDVLELIGKAQDAATSAASSALAGVKTELEGKITAAQESAAISVGRDADKSWSVTDDEVTSGVKKINFMGAFVNVVPDGDTINLYIGENNSIGEMSTGALSGTPKNGTTDVYVFDDSTFTLPVASGSATKFYKVVKAGSTFGTVTMTAMRDNNTDKTFSLDQKKNIWVRVTHDGTASDWGKVALTKARGAAANDANGNAVYSSTLTDFSADAEAGEIALPAGVSMQVGNYPLTKDHAKDGKVPGRCETQFTVTLTFDTIVGTKKGGTIKFEWAICENEPVTADIKSTSIFLTEYKKAAIASKSVAKSSDTTGQVSGITYLTSGTKVKVSTGNITDTQYKSARNTTRLTVNAAGTSTTYTADKLNVVSGSVTAHGTTYSLNETELTLGGSGSKNATVSFTAHCTGANAAGDDTTVSDTTTIANWWGTLLNGTTSLVEKWGKEDYRYEDIAVTPATKWTAAADVTEKTVTVDGTPTIGAVAQYGELMHPSQAVNGYTVDGVAKPSSYTGATGAASYIRKFTGLTTSGKSGFKLSGTNVGAIKVYWVNARNGALVDITNQGNANNGISTNEITHKYNTAMEDSTANPVFVFVIPANKTTTKVGAVTLTHI